MTYTRFERTLKEWYTKGERYNWRAANISCEGTERQWHTYGERLQSGRGIHVVRGYREAVAYIW